ncbi:hypothetical protein AWZ03_008212 [Drosophila navojoa]|uniref:Uncharacterized protein n=1 Tax=Drosophila navojoa TaxID=7232 RepID=A0A484B9N0_DRONA|nr:hypothetical protein AWZ03_008212 [Drosophila navojoa]
MGVSNVLRKTFVYSEQEVLRTSYSSLGMHWTSMEQSLTCAQNMLTGFHFGAAAGHRRLTPPTKLCLGLGLGPGLGVPSSATVAARRRQQNRSALRCYFNDYADEHSAPSIEHRTVEQLSIENQCLDDDAGDDPSEL